MGKKSARTNYILNFLNEIEIIMMHELGDCKSQWRRRKDTHTSIFVQPLFILPSMGPYMLLSENGLRYSYEEERIDPN